MDVSQWKEQQAATGTSAREEIASEISDPELEAFRRSLEGLL